MLDADASTNLKKIDDMHPRYEQSFWNHKAKWEKPHACGLQ
jgi:hypothetical protein